MFKFFDYLYYLFCKSYQKHGDDNKGAGIRGMFLIILVQLFNLFTIAILINLYTKIKIPLNKISVICAFIILLVINLIRYMKIGVEELDIEWTHLAIYQKSRIKFFIITYLVLTFILAFGLAIYVGSINSTTI
jgi:hypothetical protein